MMSGINNHSHETVRRIPKNAVGAEIGVWRGDTSQKFLASNPKEYHLVDAWHLDAWYVNLSDDEKTFIKKKYAKSLNIEPTEEAMQAYYEDVYQSVVDRFKNKDNVIIHRQDSKKWLMETDVELDWIYVDADHTYDGALFDLEACLRILKPEGVLLGDDYGNKDDVKRAVDDFVEKHGFTLEVYAHNQFQITR